MRGNINGKGSKLSAFMAILILTVYLFTSIPVSYIDTAASADIPDNAIVLEYGNNIRKITISRLVGDNWVDITEENSTDLPADARYQFNFSYEHITAGALKAAGGKMVYAGIPAWFISNNSGVLYFGNDVVADITVEDGTVIISFYDDWLNEHEDSQVFNGTFKIGGRIDWRELEKNGSDVNTPQGLTPGLHFESDLAQKYGSMEIKKSAPTLVCSDSGRYYLKYELTVTNTEDIEMPDVNIKDIFSNTSYINGYVGVTAGIEEEGYEPQETSDNENFKAGSLSADGSGMVWNIGTLSPYEIRTLTYYAEISQDYISGVTGNPVANTASVYSGDVLKDRDSSTFRSKNEIKVSKDMTDSFVDNKGNGTVTYSVTVTADDNNSFVLEDLTLKDTLPEELKAYISGGDDGKIAIDVYYGTKDEYTAHEEYTADYSDAFFEFTGFQLAPGGTVTITYTICVNNIFFINNGNAVLSNTATVSKDGRDLGSASYIGSLDKQTWSRKIVGSPEQSDITIDIDPADRVYKYNDEGTAIINDDTAADSFVVPKGSLRYQVILNESEQWDLSSASMSDEFSSDYLKYVGYVKIQLFNRLDGAVKNPSDSALINELESSAAVQTVWLRADSLGRFAFTPEELDIDGGQYTYLLTYYAKPENTENVGSVNISNSFIIEGEIGDGNGGTHFLPGIEVSVGTVVQGGIKYNAEKTSWYYEPDPAENGTVEIWTSGTKYDLGALYWVIRLEGVIPSGLVVRDVPTSGNMQFCYDSIPVVYYGPKSLDLTSYSSFGALFNDPDNGLEILPGRKYNGYWYNEMPEDAVYDWQLEGNGGGNNPLRLTFLNDDDIDLEDDGKAIYIIIRTNPSSAMPTAKGSTRTFSNDLSVGTETIQNFADRAEYTYIVPQTIFKESKGAFIYDKEADTFENCSNITNLGGWYMSDQVDKSMLETSGIYAAWLLNLNWDGSLSGTYDFADYLPDGMELLYVEVNNFGVSIKNDLSKCPETITIPELNSDPDWVEMRKTGKDDRNRNIETITYYNSETREIRWRIKNLTSRAANEKNQQLYEINFRIICKVTDPELFLNQKNTYVNRAALLDPDTQQPIDIGDASVTITLKIDKNIDTETLERLGGTSSSDGISMQLNKLPFKLEINPYGDDICDGDTLPALVDELSSTIELIEDSIEIIDKSTGNKYTDFTFDLEQKSGHQVLIIYGLPDSTPLTIKYSVRLIAKPKEQVEVHNTAYWAGFESTEPQVDIDNVKYDPPIGDIFKTENITVEITKVDFDSHSKKLDGAVFELYEEGKTEALDSKTTDSMGKVRFGKDTTEATLVVNKVYRIVERTAPSGYDLNGDGSEDENSYYFIVIDANNPLNDEEIEALKNEYAERGIELDVWYDSPDYSIVIENKKGTISVSKLFIDKNGDQFTPTSGSYRFGLFDIGATTPRSILTIVYNENGTIDYYLDGVPKETPHFTKFDPGTVYQIFELDDTGAPVSAGELVSLNGTYYLVDYSSDRVTMGGAITITNRIAVVYELPSTGGNGIYGYVFAGGMLLLISLTAYLLLRRRASHQCG